MNASSNLQHAPKLRAGAWLKHVLTLLARQARLDIAHLERNEGLAIHRLRKRMKKLRALLLLARPAMDDAGYEKVCDQVRELKNVFGSRRDAQVMAELQQSLGGEAGAKLKSLPALRKSTVARAEGMAVALARNLRGMKLAGLTWEDVEASYTKTYRKARKAWQAAAAAAADKGGESGAEAEAEVEAEALHDCRMQVKRLYYLSVVLTRWVRQPKRLRRTRKLGSLLGECHDLDVFGELVQSGKLAGPSGWDEQAEQERGKLLPRIANRAEKLFKRSPKKVGRECREGLGEKVRIKQ